MVEKLNDILKEEEVLWKQRSKVQWLREGDFNSAYFHKIDNGRRKKNAIIAIQSANGVLENQNEIELEF